MIHPVRMIFAGKLSIGILYLFPGCILFNPQHRIGCFFNLLFPGMISCLRVSISPALFSASFRMGFPVFLIRAVVTVLSLPVNKKIPPQKKQNDGVVDPAQSDKKIREKTQIYTPDCLVVIDPGLMMLPTLFNGLKSEGILILNSPKKLEKQPNERLQICGVVNATQIAVDEIKRDIPNTCLLGAFAAATGWLDLKSVLSCLGNYLSGEILERNLKSAERGYHEVEVIKW